MPDPAPQPGSGHYITEDIYRDGALIDTRQIELSQHEWDRQQRIERLHVLRVQPTLTAVEITELVQGLATEILGGD